MATEADKVNNGAMATLIAVVALGVIGVALAVTALTRMQQGAEHGAKEGGAGAEYHALVKEQRRKLAEGLPIEAAMESLARDLTKNPQAASPPAPPASAATAGAGGADAALGGAGGASAGGASAGGASAGGNTAVSPAAAGGAPAGGAPAGGKAAAAPAAAGRAAAGGASGATPAKPPEDHKHEH